MRTKKLVKVSFKYGLVGISRVRLGHAEWADPFLLLFQHAGGATDILVNQQQPSPGGFSLESFTLSLE